MNKHVWPELYKIVETDNFGGDYPEEKAVSLPRMTREEADKIAETINNVLCSHPGDRRFWKVVPESYKLQPGFEP